MDRRNFTSFLLLSLGIFMLLNVVFPQRQAPQPPAAKAPADGKAAPKAGADAKAEAPPKDAGQQPPAPVPGDLPAVAVDNTPAQFVTLGSLDPDSGYRMLVTLSNTGAVVHRAEMTSARFRDQHDRSGYLGDLELKDVAGGAQVQVVGAGTPAAKATTDGKPAPIEAGDVIIGIGNPQTVTVHVASDFNAALANTQPGQEITLQVRRGENGPQPHTIRLARRPFAVVRPEIENFVMRDAKPPADFVDRPSFLLTLSGLNHKPLSKENAASIAKLLEDGNWELAEHDDKSATFRRALPELKLEIIKRYKLVSAPAESIDDVNFPAYNLELEIELHNTSDAAQAVNYRLDGPTGMPLEGWWYAHKISQRWFAVAGLRDVSVRFAGSPALQIDCPQIAKGSVEPMGDGKALAYAGVDGQYFSAVLIPQISSLEDNWFETTEAITVGPPLDPRTPATFTNVTCRLSRLAIDLPAGATHKDAYQVFIGPKRPDLLSKYYPRDSQWAGDPTYSLRDLIYFGWFGAIARGMLAVLHFFYSIVGNYGVAIVMLTVLVRGAMFPISFKQTQSMARMQILKPEMDRINEKYKNDMQKKSQATQDLYRKHNINPLGGCLPVFLQLPIFMGLYRALMVDVELRQSPLFGHAIHWCSNLAAPDMFLNWSGFMPSFITSGMGLFGLGPYLNILPLVTVGLFLVTQKMAMPAPTNEQAAMQQKMMKYMTMFMGLMFYKVASGLCLYFIASSLWGIAERKLLPKPAAPDSTTTGSSGYSSGSGGSRPGTNGSGGKKKPGKAKPKK